MRELMVFEKPKLPHAIADFIHKCSAEAIAARGKFTVAFSGGSLPAIVCTGLLDAEAAEGGKCDFSKWHVFWADERCVPLDHGDSNYKAVTEMLLQKVPVPPAQVYGINPDLINDPAKAAEDYAAKLLKVFGEGATPSFDLMLLGMGPDGHTCSLFPGHALLEEGTALVSPIMDSPKPPSNRITLTYPVINNSKRVAFVATGNSKTPALSEIFSKATAGVKGDVYDLFRHNLEEVAPKAPEPEAAPARTTAATTSSSLPSARVSCMLGNVKFFVDTAAVGTMKIPTRKLQVQADKAAVSPAIAKLIIEKSAAAIAARGKFTVAFSGGSLPDIVCKGLLEAGADSCDYSKWHVFWADERCVAWDSEDSNYGAVQKGLISKVAIPAENVYPIDEALVGDASKAAAAYEAALVKVFGDDEPRLDMMLLGMGPDGHTCSLFPGHALLNESSCRVAAITDSPKPPASRITLTFSVVNSSRDIAFVATGSGKQDALKDIFTNPISTLPSARVMGVDGVFWYVDQDAAGELC